MTGVTLRTGFTVDLIQSVGSDQTICQAARVSTLGSEAINTEESAGLINFLMRNRHGSPFEHGLMTFRIEAPIFVWREFMRHRIGFSYNEQSGRYMEMEGVFYIPDYNRPLVQTGKAGKYQFEEGTHEQLGRTDRRLHETYRTAWHNYQLMLRDGIAKEVARMVLPISLYSTAYVTCNPRSLMSFLSLRTKHEDSKFPSFPMWEINKVADMLEYSFEWLYPLTHHAFNLGGRVSP